MRINISIIVFFLIFSSYSQQNIRADYSTFNAELTVTIKNKRIAVYALIAKGAEPKETIFLLHGLPGNEKNLDLAQNLRNEGKNVIYFNYRGSWGSEGNFLYSNCLEDISILVDYFTNEINTRKYRVNPKMITLIGHSLGAGIAIIHAVKDKRITKVIALSTFNVGNIDSINKDSFISYLDKQFMLNIDSSKFFSELINQKSAWDLGDILSFNNTAVLFIDENNRNRNWINNYKKIEYTILDSDHSFSNKRIQLYGLISKWLSKTNTKNNEK